ncbi:MAG: response regulator transcription factor [Aureispira sp.]|nr:response regulator transcription factor [Aureispira sp.]
MKLIQCIIIEDEKQTRKLLRSLLEDFCEGVEVLAEAANVKEGVEAIKKHKPELVFLDIEMPKESGFSLYKYFDQVDFEVIFTTAYSQYAVKAIKLAALDYLIKPINLEELMETLERFKSKREQSLDYSPNYQLMENALQNTGDQKIALPCSDGYIFVKLDDIIRCQSDKSYTLFILKNKEEVWTSQNLGEYTNMLSGYGFKRVHRSHLINPKFIKRFIRGKAPILVMEDNTQITIAASKKEELLKDFFMP